MAENSLTDQLRALAEQAQALAAQATEAAASAGQQAVAERRVQHQRPGQADHVGGAVFQGRRHAFAAAEAAGHHQRDLYP